MNLMIKSRTPKAGNYIIVLMICAMLFALSGCGNMQTQQSDNEESSNTQSDQEQNGQNQKNPNQEKSEIYVFIAASLKNTMEEIKTMYEKENPNVEILYNADSSGTLQTQIEEGARCDIFFSAATKQMNALTEAAYVVDGSVIELLENKIVLIKPVGEETAVTGFENITDASSLALAGEDVPVGQYARELFTNIGILDQVMKMEINEGANVTAVLTAVAEGSNEVGVVYKTDAASMPDQVEIIQEANTDQVSPAIYPVGQIKDLEATEEENQAAKDFLKYLTTDEQVTQIFETAGFTMYQR